MPRISPIRNVTRKGGGGQICSARGYFKIDTVIQGDFKWHITYIPSWCALHRMFDILSHTAHPMLLSSLRLFSQIRSSINAAAGCAIYTAQKNTRQVRCNLHAPNLWTRNDFWLATWWPYSLIHVRLKEIPPARDGLSTRSLEPP